MEPSAQLLVPILMNDDETVQQMVTNGSWPTISPLIVVGNVQIVHRTPNLHVLPAWHRLSLPQTVDAIISLVTSSVLLPLALSEMIMVLLMSMWSNNRCGECECGGCAAGDDSDDDICLFTTHDERAPWSNCLEMFTMSTVKAYDVEPNWSTVFSVLNHSRKRLFVFCLFGICSMMMENHSSK